MTLVLICFFLYLFFIFYIASDFILCQFIALPRENVQKEIEPIISQSDGNSPAFLEVVSHRSNIRRRLILASNQPSHYTNYSTNKISIHPSDQSEQFVSKLIPGKYTDPDRRILFGFFHPYANNGGGGERVLWQAVKSTLSQSKNNIVVIYTSNIEANPESIVDKVESKFKISVDSSRIVFIYLSRFSLLIDANYWKHFTLLGQLFGTMLLTYEAVSELTPDVWIDTMGLPGSYFLASYFLKMPILAYTHYPMIQQDMFDKLKNSKSRGLKDLKRQGKLIYWSVLYSFYKYLGSLVDIILANGTWTFNHLQEIWYNPSWGHQLHILYPPCGTEEMETPRDLTSRENKMVYLAQFRPEKRHELIIKEYNHFLKKNNTAITKPTSHIPTIVFVGSCRTSDDTATLNKLKTQVEELDLDEYIEFAVDVSYEEVISWLQKCQFGLNAMWNEHFGISVVEYMANGTIPIVHASAGPLLDIVTSGDVSQESWYNDVGFFFKCFEDPDLDTTIQSGSQTHIKFRSKEEKVVEYPTFSQLLTELYLTKPELVKEERLNEVREKGRLSVIERFSNLEFDVKWQSYIEEMINLELKYRKERRSKYSCDY